MLAFNPDNDALLGDCPDWYNDLLIGMINRGKQEKGSRSKSGTFEYYNRYKVAEIMEIYDKLRQQ